MLAGYASLNEIFILTGPLTFNHYQNTGIIMLFAVCLSSYHTLLSPVSIQTKSLALRVLRKRKPQETQALALASSQSWLPLLRPSIPTGWVALAFVA